VRQKLIQRLSLFLAATTLAATASAATVFDNGAPDLVSGDGMTENIQAEDFVIFNTTNVTNIRFWTLQQLPADYSGSVWWAVFSNVTSAPGVVVQGGSAVALTETATGNSSPFGAGSEYVINIPVAFQLVAGNYWLGLHNGPLTNTTPTDMVWETTAVGSGVNGVYSATTAGPWTSTLQEHAFLIEGTLVDDVVPEPGSFALLGGGLACLAFFNLKRNRSGKFVGGQL
jgi:hypothetical protein